jgi:transposase-like protein
MIEEIHCPNCKGTKIIKHGKTVQGKQRFLCQNSYCSCQTFILDLSQRGRLAEVKEQIVKMTLDGRGIRNTARVLKISPTTVITELKKRNSNPNSNQLST